eukprot:7171344-Prymnesium_polylepis.2
MSPRRLLCKLTTVRERFPCKSAPRAMPERRPRPRCDRSNVCERSVMRSATGRNIGTLRHSKLLPRPRRDPFMAGSAAMDARGKRF